LQPVAKLASRTALRWLAVRAKRAWPRVRVHQNQIKLLSLGRIHGLFSVLDKGDIEFFAFQKLAQKEAGIWRVVRNQDLSPVWSLCGRGFRTASKRNLQVSPGVL
jgi:hypothetical protein